MNHYLLTLIESSLFIHCQDLTDINLHDIVYLVDYCRMEKESFLHAVYREENL